MSRRCPTPRAIAFSISVAIDTLPDSWVLTRSKLSQSLTELDWTQISALIGHCPENAIALLTEPGSFGYSTRA
ncbi:MAG: hypothetical protein OXC95_00635 [Dehalococcoidia bacterium]|nr:hypothetical protein [Dehalococcoidia bacterium]